MAGVNKVILLGRLGQDPELRYLPNGDAVVNLSIATSERWTDKYSNEKREKTEWHSVVVYRKQAEIIQKYFKKGDQIYLEGKLQTRKWQDQNGMDRYKTEIALLNFDFVGGNQNNQQNQGNQASPNHQGNQWNQNRGNQASQNNQNNQNQHSNFDGENIPF